MSIQSVTITADDWEDYYSVQQSGTMNMIGHPLIKKFMPGNNYAAAYNHFKKAGNTEDLVIGSGE